MFSVGGMAIVVPWLYLAFVGVMIVAMSNAVNLTDGLDGLAAGTVAIVTLVFAAIAFRQNSLESALLAASVAGACVGFLWYNSYPADIFMGDTGSLGLGAAIAALAVITKTELLLLIIGGIYVAETLSVVLQVASFKLTGKRIFRMAPLHHHFEMKGWSETKVMVRFWIITGILAGAGFAMYFIGTVVARAQMTDLGDILIVGLGASGVESRPLRGRAGRAQARRRSVTRVDSGDVRRASSSRSRAARSACTCCSASTRSVGRFDLAIASPGIPPHAPLFVSAAACEHPARLRDRVRVLALDTYVGRGHGHERQDDDDLAHRAPAATLRGFRRAPSATSATSRIAAVAEADETEVLVAEVSSFQLANIDTFRPRVAVLLNVTPDHLNWHGSFDEYAAAKARVFENLGESDVAVIDVDDPGSAPFAELVAARGVDVSGSAGLQRHAGGATVVDGALTLETRGGADSADLRGRAADPRCPQRQQRAGGCGRRACPRGLGEGHPARAAHLRADRAPPGAGRGGRRASAGSTTARPPTRTPSSRRSRPSATGRSCVLLGGRNKGSDMRPLAEAVAARAKAAVVFGEAATRSRPLSRVSTSSSSRAAGLADAVAAAAALAEAG